MKRLTHTIATWLIAASILSALPLPGMAAPTQPATAHQILERTASEIGKSRNITASFTITANGQSANGTLKMSGDKFFLTLPQARIWYDGRTQWSLDTSTKEVNITEPFPEELAQVNPMVIISALHNASTPQLLKSGSANVKTLRLTPKSSQNMAFRTAVVEIDSRSNLPSKIILTLDSGQNVTLKITGINRTTNHPASTFVFNKQDYPGVNVIDLR